MCLAAFNLTQMHTVAAGLVTFLTTMILKFNAMILNAGNRRNNINITLFLSSNNFFTVLKIMNYDGEV